MVWTSGLFKKNSYFLRTNSAPGSEAARDKWLVQKIHHFFRKKQLPEAAKLPGTSGLFKKRSDSEKKFCPRQRSCPGQVACSKNNQFSAKSSAPGSEAARNKLPLTKNRFYGKKVLPQAAKLPGTSGFFKKKSIFCKKFCPRQRSCPGQVASYNKQKQKNNSLEKVLPQAAKLPGTSCLFKKNIF